jgi:hypothetical protein
VAGVAVPLGTSLVVREPSGRLVLRRSGSADLELAPAKCDARVAHADAARQLVISVCAVTKNRPPAQLLGAGVEESLGMDLSLPGDDRWPENDSRLVALYPGVEAALLDLDRRAVHRLRSGDAVLAVTGSRALVRRGHGLIVVDAVTGKEQALPGDTGRVPDVVTAGDVAVVGSVVVDVARTLVLGEVQARPLAASVGGEVLVATGTDTERPPMGPLRWIRPTTSSRPGSAAE